MLRVAISFSGLLVGGVLTFLLVRTITESRPAESHESASAARVRAVDEQHPSDPDEKTAGTSMSAGTSSQVSAAREREAESDPPGFLNGTTDREKIAILREIEQASPRRDPKTTVPVLVNCIGTTTPQVEALAIRVLGRFGSDAAPAVPSLVAAMQRSHLLAVAIRTLGEIGPEASEATPALRQVLANVRLNSGTRLLAIRTLAKMFDEDHQAIRALRAALNDSDRRIRQAARSELGRIGSDRIDS